jgi:hypothetical protein
MLIAAAALILRGRRFFLSCSKKVLSVLRQAMDSSSIILVDLTAFLFCLSCACQQATTSSGRSWDTTATCSTQLSC